MKEEKASELPKVKLNLKGVRQYAGEKGVSIASLTDAEKTFYGVMKGVGDMMRGPLIETTARRLKNEAENETKRKTALRMLKTGKLTIEEIAGYAELSVAEVERLAELQTV